MKSQTFAPVFLFSTANRCDDANEKLEPIHLLPLRLLAPPATLRSVATKTALVVTTSSVLCLQNKSHKNKQLIIFF